MILALDNPTGSLNIRSSVDGLKSLVSWINRQAVVAGLDREQCWQVELCTVEAVNNVILHAYGGRTDGTILIEWSLPGYYLHIHVHDWGKAMRISPCEKIPNGDAENGRGWFIMRSLMDRVKYESLDDRNIVTLSKNLAGTYCQ